MESPFEFNLTTVYTVDLALNMMVSQNTNSPLRKWGAPKQNEQGTATRTCREQQGFSCGGSQYAGSAIGWARRRGTLGSCPPAWLVLLLIMAMTALDIVSVSASRAVERASATEEHEHPALHVTWEGVTFQVAKTSSSNANR